MPQDWRVPNKVIETRPFGVTAGDAEVRLRMLLQEAAEAEVSAKLADAKRREQAARRSDPYIAQEPELAERVRTRTRAVRAPEQMPQATPDYRHLDPNPMQGPIRLDRPADQDAAIGALPDLARNIRAIAPDQRRVVPGIRSANAPKPTPKYTDGPQVEQERGAQEFNDPNYAADYKRREAEARLDPSVLSSEARAEALENAARLRAQGGDDDAAIATNLARLGSIAMRINQMGGPSGVVAGGIRRTITGPSAVDDLAREFEGIKGATALAIAAKLNRGRPTEADRQAAEAILPQAGDSPELVKRKMRLVLRALGQQDADNITDPLTGESMSLMDEDSTAAAAGIRPNANGSGPVVGTIVQYNGRPHRVVGVTNGMAELEPVR